MYGSKAIIYRLQSVRSYDPEFRNELIQLMVNDLLELQKSLEMSLQLNEISVYRKACHKMNSTISMLDDKEFIDIIEQVKSEDSREEKAQFFNRIVTEIVHSLQANKGDNLSLQPSNSY